MNLSEFYETYKSHRYRDKITVHCNTPGCTRSETLNKDSAARNIEHNEHFLCRSCCYTDQGRAKIAKATSYKRSEETCNKMSEAKIEFYKTKEGKTFRGKLSRLTAKGHSTNKFNKSKRHGLFFSVKNQTLVAYNSSYELRLCVELEDDRKVLGYQTQIYYEIEGRGHSLDFLIEYTTNKKLLAVEVKPKSRLTERETIEQFNDSRANAAKNGWTWDYYTEEHFGMKYKEIRDWADVFRKTLTGIDYAAHRREKNVERTMRHYRKNIATDTVEVLCEFCQATHTALRLTYDKNIARNSRYICEREGGYIAGSKPKKKKINPYAEQGMKQCIKCQRILPFDCYHLDKTHSDGRSSKCKECRK